MNRKPIRVVVLLLALAVVSYFAYSQLYPASPVLTPEMRTQQESLRKQAEVFKAESANAAKLPAKDFQLDGVPPAYPRPQSAWRSAEKAFYRSLLAKGRFEVLVVPFQVQDRAFARDLRSLMTAQLAMTIGEAAKVPIADPYLVARALGDGERRLNLSEIFDLANDVGAKRIVSGYVGHDEKNVMRVTLHAYDRKDGEHFNAVVFGPHPGTTGRPLVASDRLNSRHFENISYSEETTPIDAFQALLPGMLKFLGMDGAQATTEKPVSRYEAAQLPRSPLALVSDAAEPARDAYVLQAMAALAPRWADRERERLVEKSMLAMMRMAVESPDYRVIKARGLMYMGLRPAALRVLGTPGSAEEKHLFALLNGNLPEVRSNRPAVPAGIRALLAFVEEGAIAETYERRGDDRKRSVAATAALKLPANAWQYLVRRSTADLDAWAQFDNLELKGLLDWELPVEGFTAEGILRGALAIGDTERIRTTADLSVFQHLRKRAERSPAQVCCQPLVSRFTEADFMDLIGGIATDNLSRRARFLVQIQGTPDAARRFLLSMDAVYKDHPAFVVARAMAGAALAHTASGAESESLAKAAYVDAYNAWYWEQGQTPASAAAFDNFREVRRNDFGYFHNAFADDYPYRSYYTFWQYGGDATRGEANARAALESSCFDFWPVQSLAWDLGESLKRWDKVDELLKSIDGRFNGNPDLITLKAQTSVRRGDTQAAEKFYAEGIRMQPRAEGLYTALGKLLFENGEQTKSAKVFMSYPGLKDRSANPVGVSNYAYEAGSLYFWIGDFKDALPLYKIAANLETGSGSSMTSAIRLALLEGDYRTVLRGSLSRARRYNSPHAYRDYLGLLHALGLSNDAWQGFATVITQIDEPQVWETALVGHRIEAKSEAEIAAWAAQEPMRRAGNDYAFAPMYLLRAAITDRKPSPDLPARIEALERQVWSVDYYQRKHTVRSAADGSRDFVLGPDTPGAGTTLPLGVFAKSPKVKVMSELVSYAKAYIAVRAGKFDEARAGLEEASSLYDMRQESLGYLLPTYAYAAARARDVAALEKKLEAYTPQYRRFDYYLAKAALAGIAGKHDQALEHLKLALARRPFTERRPIAPEYQYAEICEWLYAATRDARYRNLALDWAKKNEAFHPWYSWPYAVEARLASNPAERRRAMAIGYYLDRGSERLGALPKAEVQDAVKEYGNRNPFRRAADGVPKQPV